MQCGCFGLRLSLLWQRKRSFSVRNVIISRTVTQLWNDTKELYWNKWDINVDDSNKFVNKSYVFVFNKWTIHCFNIRTKSLEKGSLVHRFNDLTFTFLIARGSLSFKLIILYYFICIVLCQLLTIFYWTMLNAQYINMNSFFLV